MTSLVIFICNRKSSDELSKVFSVADQVFFYLYSRANIRRKLQSLRLIDILYNSYTSLHGDYVLCDFSGFIPLLYFDYNRHRFTRSIVILVSCRSDLDAQLIGSLFGSFLNSHFTGLFVDRKLFRRTFQLYVCLFPLRLFDGQYFADSQYLFLFFHLFKLTFAVFLLTDKGLAAFVIMKVVSALPVYFPFINTVIL